MAETDTVVALLLAAPAAVLLFFAATLLRSGFIRLFGGEHGDD